MTTKAPPIGPQPGSPRMIWVAASATVKLSLPASKPPRASAFRKATGLVGVSLGWRRVLVKLAMNMGAA